MFICDIKKYNLLIYMLNFNMIKSMSEEKTNTEAYAEWLDAKEAADKEPGPIASIWLSFKSFFTSS